MTMNLFVVAAIVASSSLLFSSTEVQAQGRRHCNQGYGNYGQAVTAQ